MLNITNLCIIIMFTTEKKNKNQKTYFEGDKEIFPHLKLIFENFHPQTL